MRIVHGKNFRGGKLAIHILPLLVWVAALAGVFGLFYTRTQRFEVLGIARGRMHHVSAPCDGQLKMVSVQLYENVIRGQVLAMLDGTDLNAQIAAICAEIEHLMSQLILVQDTMLTEESIRQGDHDTTQRRFSVDVENIRLGMLELKTIVETDRVTLEDLGLEVKIAQELLDKQAIAEYDLEKAQALYDAMAIKIEENQRLMAQFEEDLGHAQSRREEFFRSRPHNPSIDSALEPIRKQITVQEKLIDQLLVQRRSLTLKSPADGVVVQIQTDRNLSASRRPGESLLGLPGEIVLAGETILVVAETQPIEIVAYVNEGQAHQISEKMEVKLVKNSSPPQIVNSQIAYIGPTMELMPQRLWRRPGVAEWGRPMTIKIPPDLELTPGQTVGIKGLY